MTERDDLFRETPQIKSLSSAPTWFTWIEVKLNNWSTIIPNVFVEWNWTTNSTAILDMVSYFSALYNWQWAVNSHFVKSLNMIWFNQEWYPINWNEYRLQIFWNTEDPKVSEILRWLNNEWISAEILKDLIEDLDPEKNELLLRNNIELLIDDEFQKVQTLKALDICIKAHEWQTQEKDNNWLNHIPYSNHPIKIALWALTVLAEDPEVIQAYLLHDVVEDTDYDIDYIRQEFWEIVALIIDDVTQRVWENREEYMERVKKLTNIKSKRLKSLDRYHNLLRALCRNKASYLERYIKECEEVYISNFENDQELWKAFYIKFMKTLEELKKHLKYCIN